MIDSGFGRALITKFPVVTKKVGRKVVVELKRVEDIMKSIDSEAKVDKYLKMRRMMSSVSKEDRKFPV